ncbi:MAG: glycosyltransferase family 2 protein [Oscillospiraceae bacterium]|nr:glycosyltransferase family 2 protein [Oscillospiraceae bacterium]
MLSLIVPCYNEERGVLPFFEEAKRVFDGSEYEIVFVNDGSNDGTFQELKDLAKLHENTVRVVSFSRNFGKEAALLAGLKHAAGEFLCFIDADLQQLPETAKEMLAILEEAPQLDCVCAVQEKRREGLFSTVMKGAFYKTINALSDVHFESGASDFRVFRRNVANALLDMTEHYRFTKGLFAWVGFETRYIPYRASERQNGKSRFSFWRLLRYAFDGIISFTAAPLRLAVIAGIITALGSLTYLLVVVIQKLFFAIDVPGYATIVTLILFFGGANLFFIGVVGEYLARVFTQTKNRPPYIIKATINTGEQK